jgi:galacturonosyltransferase
MKKVLFLVNHDVYLWNFRVEIIESFLRENIDVYISCPYGKRIEDIKNLGCKYIETNISRHGTNPIEDLVLLHNYKTILKKVNPDIVFSYTIKPNIYGGMACKSLHIPYVANITGLGTAVERGGILQKITVMLYKLAFKNIQKVFFQNTENMQFFVDHKIAIGKHGLLPGSGVNLQQFAPLDYPSQETIEFVFISRIMKEKGIDQYLDAAKIIQEKYPKTRFHICGFCEEAYDEKLKELQESGTIIYHGMVKDVREILKDVHCTVHPTYYPEGLSNVLLESCACARPIITTDRSGCREVVDDGLNGFVVEQQNSKDLIEKIEKFIQLPYEQKKLMGLKARKKVEKQFDRKIVVEAYMTQI